MTVLRMARTMAKCWQQVMSSAHRFNELTHGWLGILMGAAREALKPGSAITAAAIAYFALFSLFPLTLLSISIASFNLGPLMDQQLIVQKLAFVGPALFLASFTGSMIANLRTWLPDQIIPIGRGISLVVAILLDIALFMV